MLKKLTSIIFVFIASFVLLAHVVVPHQHCEGHVCITESYDRHECDHHKHDSPFQKHNHDHNSSSSKCVLSQVLLLLPSNSLRLDLDVYHYPGQSDFFNGTLAIFLESRDSSLNLPEQKDYGCFYSQTINTVYAATKLGFRGPPLA